ncbi:MAG TPA: hypothetical protein VL492_10915 [Methylovirgula sp.]|nr:hypothetical protein [Methylovirgula sp.]
MNGDASPRASLGEKAVDELKQFSITAAYLFLCFVTVMYFKAAVLQAHGITFVPFGFALAKALICAKFVSLGYMFHLGNRFNSRPLIWSVLYKAACFMVLLLVLNAVEEIVVGSLHGRSPAETLADFAGGTRDQLIAESLIILWCLVPFFAFQALGEIMGEKRILTVFFKPRSAVGTKA